ncbi:MAG: hypothetical protein LBI71_11290 [Enterobacteriaceae bacterium]|jgi:hypothetical protein|nr:hypothetical protein [Enterobacteriaceae bacterium]
MLQYQESNQVLVPTPPVITITTSDGVPLPPNSSILSNQVFQLNLKIQSSNKFTLANAPTIAVSVPSEDAWATVTLLNQKLSNDLTYISAALSLVVKDGIVPEKSHDIQINSTNPSELPNQKISYYVVDLDSSTLSLTFDKVSIETPTNSNKDPSVTVSTVILDKKGNPIPKLNMIVGVNSLNALSLFKITDSHNNDTLTPIKDANSNFEFIRLTTDTTGKLEFQMYPSESPSSVLHLVSSVHNSLVTVNAKTPLFIINKALSEQSVIHPDVPEILQLNNNIITPVDNETSFDVKIYPYADAIQTDYILFVANDTLTEYYYQVGNLSNLGKYAYQLPYTLLKSSGTNSLGYYVATSRGPVYTSYTLADFTYSPPSGGSNPQNSFVLPTVYSSFGTTSGYILPERSVIDYNDVSDYILNGGTALYIGIELGVSGNTQNKVAYGTSITVTLRIPSSNNGAITKQYIKVMACSGTLDYIPIPFVDIENTGSVDLQGTTPITIQYSVTGGGKGQYSKIWNGSIDTIVFS